MSADVAAPRARALAAAAWALATAWLVSTVALHLPGVSFAVGSGFLATCMLMVATFALLALRQPDTLREGVHAHRDFLVASAIVLAAHVVAAAGCGAPRESVLQCLRVVAVAALAWLVRVVRREALARRAFAWAGFVFLVAHAVMWTAGMLVPAIGAWVFVALPHQHLGALPRFTGLTGIPASTGTWALVALALSRGLAHRGLRALSAALGIAVAFVSLSPATLAIPAVLAAAVVRPPRLRIAVAALGVVAAVVALYVHVLAVRVPGRAIEISPLHPSYALLDLGPRYMPVHDVGALGFGARFHATAYYALAARGFSCLAEHPALGVGPQRFDVQCPVVTMSTYGSWSRNRKPHNQLTGLLAELGLVGAALLVAAAMVLRRAYRLVFADAWAAGAALGVFVCAFSGDVLVTFPVAAALAAHLEARARAHH